MSRAERDRLIELHRYNARADGQLASAALGPDGSAAIDVVLREPYLRLEGILQSEIKPGTRVLDLCCGDGIHSIYPARLGAAVTAADIAEKNLLVARARAVRAGVPLATLVANAEELPLPEQSFDVVMCVGSLSYVDLDRFAGEVRRVLRRSGAFVFVDSLNHNPIYRFNRWLHYRRGERSLSTLQRMPTLETLGKLRTVFPDLMVSYHGALSFLAPVLRPLGPDRIVRWLDAADNRCHGLHRFAFKIVGTGHRCDADS